MKLSPKTGINGQPIEPANDNIWRKRQAPVVARFAVFLAATLLFLSQTVLAADSPSLSTNSLPDWDAGPLYDRFPLTLDTGFRAEALGPLLSYEIQETDRTYGLHPVFSWRSDPVAEFKEADLLYPLLTYNGFGKERRFQILQLFSFGGGQSQEEGSETRRFTLFPFFFYQDSPNPEKDYWALVPFYGHLKNRLMRDEIFFVAFPAYSKTRKEDVVTRNYVYPFFHLREGDGLSGWQFWPLAGREQKAVTYSTNMWNETELEPGHEKFFALWPIFFKNQLGIGSENPQKQLLVLPLFSLQRSPLRDTSTYLWPFGLTYTVDREKKYREWGAPWPLVVFARGEGKTANRVWPFFSQARTPALESEFYAWPIYKRNRITSDPLYRDRTRILLFLYSDLIERNTETGTALHRTDLWPLFTARRDHAGNERLQILSLLEPLLPNNRSIERNYSPLWSLWRSEKNAQTGARSQSLLWNLYRADKTPEKREYSFLFGLFRYRATPEGRDWRLFYFPFESSRKSKAPSGGVDTLTSGG